MYTEILFYKCRIFEMGFQFYIKVDGQLTLIIDIFIKKI